MKKALLTTLSSNRVMQDDLRALKALLGPEWETELVTLGSLGKAYDRTIINGQHVGLADYAIEEYSLIVFSIPYSAMHVSNWYTLDAVKHIFDRAKPGALALLAADTTLPMDPSMWNAPSQEEIAEALASGRTMPKSMSTLNSYRKENPYLLKPMKVIGSFSAAIEQDNKAMSRIRAIWLNKLHPDSEFVPVEWLSGMIHFVPGELETQLKELPKANDDIRAFYFGLDKKKIVKSLKGLGFGDDPRDAVFGSMGKNFPGIKDLSVERRFLNNPASWLSLVAKAEMNLLPYDPIKGDYQFTKRFLEIAVPNRASIVADPKLESTGLTRYLELDAWWETATRVSKELNELF